MNARDQAIVRAHRISAPEDAQVRALCERFGYGAVMDSAARLWAQRDPMGALYVAGDCLACRDLFGEAREISNRTLAELQAMGEDFDSHSKDGD